MVSGVNLPAAKLQVAMGIPLHRIHHIRQLYAGNLDAGFKPSLGSLQELNFCASTNAWGTSASRLHEFANSQFGHINVYGEDGGESQKNMVVVAMATHYRLSKNQLACRKVHPRS